MPKITDHTHTIGDAFRRLDDIKAFSKLNQTLDLYPNPFYNPTIPNNTKTIPLLLELDKAVADFFFPSGISKDQIRLYLDYHSSRSIFIGLNPSDFAKQADTKRIAAPNPLVILLAVLGRFYPQIKTLSLVYKTYTLRRNDGAYPILPKSAYEDILAQNQRPNEKQDRRNFVSDKRVEAGKRDQMTLTTAKDVFAYIGYTPARVVSDAARHCLATFDKRGKKGKKVSGRYVDYYLGFQINLKTRYGYVIEPAQITRNDGRKPFEAIWLNVFDGTYTIDHNMALSHKIKRDSSLLYYDHEKITLQEIVSHVASKFFGATSFVAEADLYIPNNVTASKKERQTFIARIQEEYASRGKHMTLPKLGKVIAEAYRSVEAYLEQKGLSREDLSLGYYEHLWHEYLAIAVPGKSAQDISHASKLPMVIVDRYLRSDRQKFSVRLVDHWNFKPDKIIEDEDDSDPFDS